MKNVKEFIKRHQFLLIIFFGIVIALANYTIYPKMIKADLELIELPVASSTLNEGVQIIAKDIRTVQVTKEFLEINQIETNKENIIGKYVVDGHSVANGSFFYKESLSDKANIYGSIAKDLKAGEVEFTISVADLTDSAPVHPFKDNQKLNVYFMWQYQNEFEQVCFGYGEIIHNVRIIDIVNNEKEVPTYMVFAVSEEEAAYLHLAQMVGKLMIHLPDQFGGNESVFSVEDTKDVIDEHGYILWNDEYQSEDYTPPIYEQGALE